MYQRLLILLLVVFISGVSTAQNVMTPTDGDYIYNPAAAPDNASHTNPTPVDGVIQKWVHDPTQKNRIPWDQTNFKSYRLNKTSFRLRFPINYNPANKYPIIIFLHGAGEMGQNYNSHNTLTVDRENQDQLYWGAQLFEQRMNAGEWNGFLLFPQQLGDINYAGSQWDDNTFPNLNNILDTLVKYNGLDQDRVLVMGLSAGGVGAITYAIDYPKRIATVVSSSPKEIETLLSSMPNIEQIPVWVATGGADTGPDPGVSLRSRDSLAVHGANVFFTYDPTSGHDTWEAQWAQKDIYNKVILSKYWNATHKAQPLVYFQNTQFCTGQPISAKMALTPGFAAYEWQYDNGGGFATIPAANTYTYTATQVGQYRARFKRNIDSAWSAWSPSPIVISTKTCSTDTAFVEHFETTPTNPYITFSGGPVFGNSPYFYQNTECQNGIFANGTEVFSQDGSGRQGGRFMINNTTAYYTTGNGASLAKHCEYFSGDQVWRTYNPVTVTPYTDYTLSFYIGNSATSASAGAASPVTQLIPKINNIALTALPAQTTLVGDLSWKKVSYAWNSGNLNYAEIAITNNTSNGAGNDFVLDEISLVKSKPTPLPAGVNPSFWSQAGNIIGYDGSPVKVWTNNDINGNNLQQNTVGREPSLKNNAGDNINFNPVVAYNSSLANSNFISGGFSGTASHGSVHVYMVTEDNSTASGQTLLFERQASGAFSFATTSTNALTWNAGSGTNQLSTPSNTNEAGKPVLWTLSKDNSNGTGNGNKQDIRKNGVVVAASSGTTTFTGNSGNFRVGASGNTTTSAYYNGSIAEIIYLLDTSINAATENKIESYLALKYGTTLGYKAAPANYAASDATLFWPGASIPAFGAYNSNVFGIGTDSASALVQSISNSANTGSGDGTGQSGLGNLVLSTSNTLLDKRFLVIGTDSLTLAQTVIAAGNPLIVGSTRVGRNWKVANTGSVGAVTLSFDTTGLGNQAGGAVVNKYALLMSNSGDATYSGTVSFFNATGASGNKIIFSGVTLANGAVFTIITNNLNTALPAVWLGLLQKQ